MLRVAAPGLIGLILFCVWAYAVFDVITAESVLIRNLPSKLVWLLVVVFLNLVGAVAWFAFGRPLKAPLLPRSHRSKPDRSWLFSTDLGAPPRSDGPRDWVDRARQARAAESAAEATENENPDDPDDDKPPSEGSG